MLGKQGRLRQKKEDRKKGGTEKRARCNLITLKAEKYLPANVREKKSRES